MVVGILCIESKVMAASVQTDMRLSQRDSKVKSDRKATGSGQKMAKTKTVQKTTYMWHSPSKG